MAEALNDYRGHHSSQASQESNGAACSFLLPETTDRVGLVGAAGEGQLPLCPPALGPQVSIHRKPGTGFVPANCAPSLPLESDSGVRVGAPVHQSRLSWAGH